MKKEYWVVEAEIRGYWHTDDTGPNILYDTREAAYVWAVKLAALHPVRLRHTTDEHEEVTIA